jgi:hypothetical protein
MLVGIAKTCSSMTELQRIMAERFGAEKVQLSLYLRLPSSRPELEEETEAEYQTLQPN